MNLLLATACVLLFSLTVPATRLAALAFPSESVALLRLLGAGIICVGTLLFVDRWTPPRKAWFPLFLTSAGSVLGFSFLSALAMKQVPATHGAVALTSLPALTAVYASLRDRLNPGFRFWMFCIVGTALSFSSFALRASGGFLPGDAILAAAILVSAFGYVEGGRLSRVYGGRRVMSWAVVFSLPFSLGFALTHLKWETLPNLSDAPLAWGSATYLAIVSQSVGMFVWFKVLARGPMEKIALVQLIQPFFSLLAAVYLLGENAPWETWAVAALVGASVFGANREKKRAAENEPVPIELVASANARTPMKGESSETRSSA